MTIFTDFALQFKSVGNSLISLSRQYRLTKFLLIKYSKLHIYLPNGPWGRIFSEHAYDL
jgi:hypothetical protein